MTNMNNTETRTGMRLPGRMVLITLGAFFLGLFLGFTLRPAILEAVSPTGAGTRQGSTSLPSPGAIQTQQQAMEYLISQTRHFKGDPDAPITMIEFSDYQ